MTARSTAVPSLTKVWSARDHDPKARFIRFSVITNRYDDRCAHFFVSERPGPLNYHVTARTFVALVRRLGLRGPAGSRGASLHALRHTFAVNRLLTWYRWGLDVRARLPELSVYLGHVRPQDTYWYLSATPDLLRTAGERFDQHAGATP